MYLIKPKKDQMKLEAQRTSGATFTSELPLQTTLQELIGSGWKIDDEQVKRLEAGETVALFTYNLAGTPSKLTLKKQ